MPSTAIRISIPSFLVLLFCTENVSADTDDPIVPLSTTFWLYIAAIIALITCSGIVAGLTLGLLSQDATNLAIISAAGTPQQRKYASRIIPIRKNGHLLLTSLLLTSTVLNETLPILCDSLFGKGYVAIVISTALIVIFSEILPQAICSRHGLAIGAFFSVPVRVLIFVWYLLAWPIAKVLDSILGKHRGFMYGKPELSELIHLHGDSVKGGPLDRNTVEVLRNILDLSGRSAGDMVTIKNTSIKATAHQKQPLMLDMDTLLTRETMNAIRKSGADAVPVYSCKEEETPKIQGILQTKSIILQNPSENIPLRKLTLEPVLYVPSSASAVCLLQILTTAEQSTMALVYSFDDAKGTDSTLGLVDDRIFRHDGSTTSMKQLNNIVPLGLVTLHDLLDKIFAPPTPPHSKAEQHGPEEILIHNPIERTADATDEKLDRDVQPRRYNSSGRRGIRSGRSTCNNETTHRCRDSNADSVTSRSSSGDWISDQEINNKSTSSTII